MGKGSGLSAKFQDGDEKILVSRIADAVDFAYEKHNQRFICIFMDPRQQETARQALSALSCRDYSCWGGYEGAERQMLCVYGGRTEPSPEEYPIRAVRLIGRDLSSKTHRDVLGTLMSLGIKRETVGDIVFGENDCVVLLAKEIAAHVAEGLVKVGGAGVRTELLPHIPPIVREQPTEPLRDTVASSRLDCVVASLLNMSRGSAEELIDAGLVSVNWREQESRSLSVKAGDTLSVRGRGRFVIDDIGTPTKKGRLVLLARKYL